MKNKGGYQIMGVIADAFKKLQENSEDLSSLPNLIAKVEEIEGNEMMYQEKISKLQEVNRNYLAQIPIPGQEPKEEEPEEEPTIEDATNYLIDKLGGKK